MTKDLNIVKWITDAEIEVVIRREGCLEDIAEKGIKVYKHPKNGTRMSQDTYYIRFTSDKKYSVGAYDFPENPPLEELTIKLHGLGFVFWGNFKTEISPYDYMQNLQRRGILKENFKHIQAGENVVKVSECNNA